MKRLAVVAFIVVGVCALHPPASPASVKPTIHFVGDSITVGSTPELRAYFGHSYTVTINAVSGSTTYADAHYVYADMKARPTVEVINLGTNDTNHIGVAWGGVPAQTWGEVLHRFNVFGSHTLWHNTCIVFVNISTHMASWNPVNAAVINAHLKAWPHVVDWNGAWNPRYFDTTNNVHPNEIGRQVLVHLIAAEVARCSR
jgi:lysophospholipase L1-like esterase